jgi:hypothetical protein
MENEGNGHSKVSFRSVSRTEVSNSFDCSPSISSADSGQYSRSPSRRSTSRRALPWSRSSTFRNRLPEDEVRPIRGGSSTLQRTFPRTQGVRRRQASYFFSSSSSPRTPQISIPSSSSFFRSFPFASPPLDLDFDRRRSLYRC